MKSKRPVILVTNDDGITSPGIRALIEVMRLIGEVVVVAPDKGQSGMGHAITMDAPLRLQPHPASAGRSRSGGRRPGPPPRGGRAIAQDTPEEKRESPRTGKVLPLGEDLGGAVIEYSCSGTPVDCLKLAVNRVLHRKPDLCVSGINHGSNSSINVIYSGTMSAALEGAIEGIPSIGFSLCNKSIDADFSVAKKYVKAIVENALKHGVPEGTCLNVNIPDVREEDIKGIKVCRQANAKWEEDYKERTAPDGKKQYWLTGVFKNYDDGDDTDEWALENNYVSIVPIHIDFTAHHAISYLNKWEYEI